MRKRPKLLQFLQPVDMNSKYYYSYSYRILKIFVLSIVLLVIYYVRRFLDINAPISKCFALTSIPIVIACFFGIYVSIAEILGGDFKKQKEQERSITKEVNVEDVINMVRKNDIIEFTFLWNKNQIRCGSSADSNPIDIFDKRYYIEEETFLELKDFKKALSKYSKNNRLELVTVDGLCPDSLLIHNTD